MTWRRSRSGCAPTSRPTRSSSRRSSRRAKRRSSISQGQPYKEELIRDLPEGEAISLYRNGPFVDLCRGPHLARPGKIGAIKLMSVAGAYWRGDEKRPMLQRIYGTAWPTQAELDAYLALLEEARKRDHRKLGRELGLFYFNEDVGAGIPLFSPKGEQLRYQMERYVRETQTRYGYEHVWTGHLVKESLYRKSGHYDNYSDVMFPPMVDEDVDVPAEADELPLAHDALQRDGRPFLPRSAAALRGVRHALPLRDQRHALRPDARAGADAGRLPHLLHGGADPGGVQPLPPPDHGSAGDVWPDGLPRATLAARRRGQVRQRPGEVGEGDRGAARLARRQRRRLRCRRRRGGVLRPEGRLHGEGCPRARVAALDDPGRLHPAGVGSTASTSPRMAGRTRRSSSIARSQARRSASWA